VTRWDDEGRPAEWVTEVEPEFDVNERDSWYALAELRDAICPSCGNFKAICSTPEGLDGDGYYVAQHVCYATATREATLRRIAKKFEKTKPDVQGFLPTDGVSISVALVDPKTEDALGLDSLAGQGAAEADQGEDGH
jgi:hypothetical protein